MAPAKFSFLGGTVRQLKQVVPKVVVVAGLEILAARYRLRYDDVDLTAAVMNEEAPLAGMDAIDGFLLGELPTGTPVKATYGLNPLMGVIVAPTLNDARDTNAIGHDKLP